MKSGEEILRNLYVKLMNYKKVRREKLCLVGLVLNHQSLYRVIIRKFLKNNFEITLITRTSLISSFNEFNDLIFINSNNEKSDFKIIKKNINTINSTDVLFIDEIFDNFYRGLNLKIKPKKRFLILHNPNRWFLIFYKFNLRFFDTLFFRNIFLNQFHNFITISPSVQDYLSSINQHRSNIFFIPFDYAGEILDKSNNEEISITIPGSINENRRNYLSILEKLHLYFDKNPDSKIQIKLLGKLRNDQRDIINLISKINLFKKRIKYWKDYVSDMEFEKEMEHTSYLLSNINVILIKDNRVEIYGQTKETGITYLAYKWAIPLILPYNQVVFNEIESQVIRYNEPSDLIKILGIIETQNKDLLRTQCKINFERFNEFVNRELNCLLEFIQKN